MSDDADDDPQLKSLRAVWLAMPDEEPPERGLAELMAAARVKAEAMAQPSWWQRIVALLRRPPVFALATLMILIGGGLFIAQRREKLEATGPAVQEVAIGQPGAIGSAAAPQTIVTPPAEPALQSNAEPAAVPEAAPSDDQRSGVKTDPAPARTKRNAATAVGIQSTGSRGSTTSRGELDGRKDDARDKASELKLQSEDREEAPVITSDRFASPPPEPKVSAQPKAEASGGDGAGGAAAPQADSEQPATTSTSTGSTARPSRAPQYIAQARSAAARGDCSAARLLMKRVASEDAAAYRTALAKDASLKKCVAAN